jgi:glycosyltransferase involved in cell wall biosynthesis
VPRAPDNHLPYVSVVVPVRDGESTIGDCLDSILATDYPTDRREVLVVDNGSSDGTATLIQSRPVRYLREQKRGVSNARNRGIAESRGEILAFVDADCLVEPQWLTELVRPFADQEVGSVAGDLQHAPPTTAAERQAARMLGNWQQFAFNSNPAYPITANAAFQERSGLRLAYAERATARHRHRSTQGGFFRQQLGWAYGAGLVAAKFEAMGGHPITPPRIHNLAGPLQGLGMVIWAWVRRRGRRQWIEDAWFDFLRDLAWWIGARAGLRCGGHIWQSAKSP